MIKSYRLVTPVIASNVATVTSEVIHGEIVSVEINYPANTCTVDLNSQQAIGQEILNLAAANTDTVVYPRTPLHDETGTALDLSDAQGGDTALYGEFVIHGRLKLDLASGTNGEKVTIHINVRE